MTEAQFNKFVQTWCDRAVASGSAAEVDFLDAAGKLGYETKPPKPLLADIFSEFLIDILTVAMRARWGGAERVDVDGRPAVRGMIPVDQFARRETMPIPAKVLARAQRAYFDD